MWRSLAAGAARAGEARNVALADERAALSRHHRGLKAALQAFRTDETARLRTLSLATCDQSPLVGLCSGKVFRACSHCIPSGHDRENNARLVEQVSSKRQSSHTVHAWADPEHQQGFWCGPEEACILWPILVLMHDYRNRAMTNKR